jgi:hypothetical protein
MKKKENPTNKLNVGLCYSNHKTDEYQKYVLIQINNRLYELSVNGYPYTVTCDPDDFGGFRNHFKFRGLK